MHVIDARAAEPVEKSVQWLHDLFGAVNWHETEPHPDAGYVFRLVELQVACGPATLKTHVIDENGDPLEKIACIRYWMNMPDKHRLPAYDPPASRYTDLGVIGKTNSEGVVGWGMGEGDYYNPPHQVGATTIYIADFDGPSDYIEGLGMLAATNHCTIHQVFQRLPTDTPGPGPTPEPTDLSAAFRAMAEGVALIAAGLAGIAASLEEGS